MSMDKMQVNELVARWRKLQAQRPALPSPVELVERAPMLPTQSEMRLSMRGNLPPLSLVERTQGARIDLPRRCAVHGGQIWLASYVWQDGAYRYGGAVVPENAEPGQYRPENMRKLPESFRAGRECCAWCGRRPAPGWFGAVWCDGCRSRVCFGRTTEAGYFVCWCGDEGQLEDYDGVYLGVIPGRR
jgi:hypothetical protein